MYGSDALDAMFAVFTKKTDQWRADAEYFLIPWGVLCIY